ncbi:MAG: hypothetical protein Q9167_007290, partial [Letrouitia subvulpina]
PPHPRRHELLKHPRKLPADLLERALDRLVLALVQHLDQLLDARLAAVQLPAPLRQQVPLLREVVVLLKRLLVDVPVPLEPLVDLVQPLHDRVALQPLVPLQRPVRHDPQVPDLRCHFPRLLPQDPPLPRALLRPLLLLLELPRDLLEPVLRVCVPPLERSDLSRRLVDGCLDFLPLLLRCVGDLADALELGARRLQVAPRARGPVVELLRLELVEPWPQVLAQLDLEDRLTRLELAPRGRQRRVLLAHVLQRGAEVLELGLFVPG